MSKGKADIKVLVCEDDEGILEVLTIALRSQGFVPISVTDPADVSAILKRERPRILLLDLHMRGEGDGEDLLIDVKRRASGVRIVLMSGHSKLEETALRHSVDFLAKPFDLRTLKDVLERNA